MLLNLTLLRLAQTWYDLSTEVKMTTLDEEWMKNSIPHVLETINKELTIVSTTSEYGKLLESCRSEIVALQAIVRLREKRIDDLELELTGILEQTEE